MSRFPLTRRATSPAGFIPFLTLAGLLLFAPEGAEAQMATGSYVGDGTAPRPIVGVGFRPDVVIVKVDFSNATDTTCSSAVVRTSTMAGDASKLMHGIPLLGAPCPSPSTGLIPNLVQSLDANGFTVGNDDRVNGAPAACGGANCTYHWVAFKANGNLRLGTYAGNGTTLSITGLAFSPEYVMVLPANNNKAQHRTPAGGTRSDRFDAGGATTTGITSLDADGFTVTAGGAPDNLDAAGVTYHYAAWNAVPGATAVGTYAGDGVDNRPIDLPGFPPRYVIVQSYTDASGRDAFQRTETMAGDASIDFRGAANANRIQALRPGGFEVGTYTGVNTASDTYAFVAFGAGADNPCSAGGSWWNAAWGRRRRIVFNNSAQAENLVDFPVLIELDSSRIDYARTQNAGQDLRFVDSDNETVLAHEIERWDEAGTSYVWVRVPQINASSAGDFIYMYYDNAGAPDGQNAAAVWSSDYRAVWHLKEDPAGAPPQMKDSTSNTNDGTAENSPTQTAGQIDGSLAFVPNAAEQNVNVADSASLRLTTDMTVSAWVQTTSGGDGQSRVVVAKWRTAGSRRNYWLGIWNGNTLSFHIDGLTASASIPVAQVNDGQWHHVVGVADAAGTALRLFLDGTPQATVFYDGSTAEVGNVELRIARSPDQTLQDWDGGIDEVRVLGVARTAAWIRAQYLSMTDAFVTFGSEVGACRLRSIGSKGNNFYSAGSVGATNGSWLVTGSGTAWKDPTVNCGRGDKINIDGTDYTILTVVSDTELRLSSVFTGTDGSGKAYAISRKFTTLQAWENCVSGAAVCPGVAGPSLVGDNRSEVGIAYKDSVFALPSDFIIDGSTTDTTHTITLTADGINRHYGTPGAGVVVNANSAANEIQVFDSNVTIEWLELRGLRGGASNGLVRVIASNIADRTENILLQDLLVHDFLDTTPGNGQSGIRLSGDGFKSVTIRNCMVWNGDEYGLEADEATDLLTIDNCSIDNITDTTDGTAAGVYAAKTLNVLVRNTIVTRTGSLDYRVGTGSFSPSSTNNVSEDPAGPGGAPGTAAFVGVVPGNVFMAPGSDLHLKAGSVAIDTGVSLASSFFNDIDGGLRPVGAAWDRGADESGTTEVVLQSFTASPLDSAVELVWATASELQNLGFHVYRSSSEAGPYQRITPSLIPGLGSSATGARYSYLDTGLVNGVTYYYELEDVETTGVTRRHGPVPATPQPGGGSAAGGADSESGGGSGGSSSEPASSDSSPGSEVSPARIVYGDPSAVSLQVVERNAQGVEIELITGGFYATPENDGSVRLEIPGFEVTGAPGTPAIPVRQSFLEAVAGRRVEIAAVVPRDVVGFSSLRPALTDAPELVVGRDGTVRAGRRGARGVWPARGLYPEQAARVVSTAFQGEVKKALVELCPLRFDPRSGQLLLARRLRVRLVFAGREAGEIALGGSRGRADRRPHATGETVLVRLATRERGLYAVSFEQLFPGDRRALLASALRLRRRGQAVAFHLEPNRPHFGPGSVLYFLSEGAALSAYANEAVYELSFGAGGLAMPSADASPTGSPVTYALPQQEWETNRFYLSGLLEAPDLWLWDSLVSGARKSFAFGLAGRVAGSEPARLSVWLQGGSDLPDTPDHHVRVRVNGTVVAEAIWDGKTSRALEAELSVSLLRDGDNLLELENVPDTGAAYSMIYLDRFALRYPHTLAAEAGRFEASFSQSGVATVAGIGAGSAALDTTEATPCWLGGAALGAEGLRLRVEAGRRYLVVSPAALLSPEIRRPTAGDLESTQNQADYVVVAPREFLPAAAPLLALRESQGLTTRAVAREEIDEQFGYGEREPEAIRDFLTYAYHHWSTPSPRYVLLLGDATQDPKDYAGTGVEDRIPTWIFASSYLWTASDPAYAAVNGDDWLPDLALGRLPAASLAEAKRMVEKVVAFETGGFDLSGPSVLVADNPDPAGDFESNAEEIATSLLADRETERIYLGRLGTLATRSAIRAAFDRGASLLSYIGHGGTAVWASENVLNSWDVAGFTPQAQQPLVLTWDCLNGYFLPPTFDSLSEALLKAEGRGAVAAFSPSGLSLDGPAHLYHKALLGEIVSGRHARLGDAILAAQDDYASTGAFPELLRIYHLFGDPALSIR